GTVLNGGAVTTSGAQNYGDLLTLGANTVLTGASGSFAGVDGGGLYDLTLTLGGTTAIDGSFWGIDDLTSNGGGDTSLSGTIVTTGTQTYDDAVNLTGATELDAG